MFLARVAGKRLRFAKEMQFHDRTIQRLFLNDPEEIIKQPQRGKPAVDGERGERFFETVIDVPIDILRGGFRWRLIDP